MVKQILLPLAAVALFIVIVGIFVNHPPNINIPGLPTPIATAAVKTVKIGDTSIQVEIANTPEARAQGLSGRTDLVGDNGMLFIFDPSDKSPGFWMRGMLIPLDIIWIKAGVVVKIDKNVQPPAPGTPDSALTVYTPGQAIDNVLEVRGGYSDANGITVGSNVDLPKI